MEKYSVYISETRNGRGLFVRNKIVGRNRLLEISGELLSVKEIEADGVFSKLSANAYRRDNNLYLNPTGQIGEFINHSCSPNCFVDKKNGKLLLYSISTIPGDTELLIDYSTIMLDDDEWIMVCNCGEIECRGTIKKYSSLSYEVHSIYEKLCIMPNYLFRNS